MSKSKWKGPYVNFKYLKSFDFLDNKKKLVLLISRDSVIIPKFLGYTFKVHTGNSFVELLVTKEMIGHKFGEFVMTRAVFNFKKKKKKN